MRGSEALQLLKCLLKPTLLILIWMTFLRLLLVAAFFYPKTGMHPDLPDAFWAGFRFDLLVLGFAWIPILALTWMWALFFPPRKLFFFWKVYFVVAVLLIFDLSWMDFFWTAVTSSRLNHEIFSVDSRQILDEGWKLLGSTKSWIATLGMGLSSLGLVIYLHELKLKKDDSTPPKWKIALQAFLTFLLVAFAARGTWTPHHLNIEHAQVSENSLLNQVPLNPLWNLDK